MSEVTRVFGSMDWANEQVRFAIAQLKDSYDKNNDFHLKSTLQLVLFVKGRLLECGFQWQARLVEFWIHRYRMMWVKRSKMGRKVPGGAVF